MPSQLWSNVIFYGKITGALATTIGFIWGGIKWMIAGFKKLTEINTNVTLLTTNHLPHIQQSLNEHGTALEGIKSDVRNMDEKIGGVNTRLDDTKEGVKILGESFLRHLEDVSIEIKKPVKKRK